MKTECKQNNKIVHVQVKIHEVKNSTNLKRGKYDDELCEDVSAQRRKIGIMSTLKAFLKTKVLIGFLITISS